MLKHIPYEIQVLDAVADSRPGGTDREEIKQALDQDRNLSGILNSLVRRGDLVEDDDNWIITRQGKFRLNMAAKRYPGQLAAVE